MKKFITIFLLFVTSFTYAQITTIKVQGSGGGITTAVDSIWRTLGQDSIKFSINGRLRSVKDSSGSIETASNGLTKSVNDIKLGGLLTANTTILTAGFNLIVDGTSQAPVFRSNSTTGIAVGGFATGLGTGIHGQATTGIGGNFIVNPATTNTIANMVAMERRASGTAANGIGGGLAFNTQSSTGTIYLSSRLVSKFTDVIPASRTSQFDIEGVNNAVTETFANFQTGSIVIVGNGADTLATLDDVRNGSGAGGTVTNIATGYGLSGGPITTTGTLLIDTSVSGLSGKYLRLSDAIPIVLTSVANGDYFKYQLSDNSIINFTPTFTGTGAFVLANTPTLITPIIGVASATTINFPTTTGTGKINLPDAGTTISDGISWNDVGLFRYAAGGLKIAGNVAGTRYLSILPSATNVSIFAKGSSTDSLILSYGVSTANAAFYTGGTNGVAGIRRNLNDAFTAFTVTQTHASSTGLIADFVNSGGSVASISHAGMLTAAGITLSDATNIVLNATTGTKIGTATSQKLGFYNSTPIVQPSGSVITALTNLGLVASPTIQGSELTLTDVTTNNASISAHGFAPKYPNDATKYLDGTGAYTVPASGSGTVSSVSVTTANGVSGSVATATTTPAITLTLGAITPTTVNGNTFTTGSSTYTGTAAQTYTFPTTTATIARTDAAQSFTGTQTMLGALIYSGGIQASTTTNGNMFLVSPFALSGTVSTAQYEVNSNPVQFRVGYRGSTSTVATAGNDVWALVVGNNTFTEATSGTSALAGGLGILTQTFTNGSGATTDFQNLYIGAAPTGATNNYALNTGFVHEREGHDFAYIAKTATYTATNLDYVINCTANTFTVTLPTAVGVSGRTYIITNPGGGTITIATTSSQTFTNVTATPTTLTLLTLGASVQVMSDGANWIKLN